MDRSFRRGLCDVCCRRRRECHPHAASPEADKARWDRDIGNFNNDLKIVEKFFLELSEGKLSASDEMKMAYSFFGIQGPWYTVGWQMAVAIESTFGRAKLIECFCDQRNSCRRITKPLRDTIVNRINNSHRGQRNLFGGSKSPAEFVSRS